MKMNLAGMGLALMMTTMTTGASASEVNLSKYWLVSGGMGIEGATAQPDPLPESADQAVALYDALDVKPHAKKKVKEVGIQAKGESFGLTCRRTYRDCSFMVVMNDADLEKSGGFNASLTFKGAIARAIYDVLPLAPGNQPMGAGIRSAANLKCVQTVVPGRPVNCTFSNVNYTAFTLQQMIDQAGDEFTRADAEHLLKDAKIE